MITITNHGPLIANTNYWDSAMCRAGKVIASPNAGAIRLLLPPCHYSMIGECRTSAYVIITRGPWPEMRCDTAFELLFEDESASPYVVHLTTESFVALPTRASDWIVSLWICKRGRPHKALERPAKFRAGTIPCLLPWSDPA